MFLCLAGQACRGSEEEQGDEGGGLPVDEGHEEPKERGKKIKRGKQRRTQQQLGQILFSYLMFAAMILNKLYKV